MAASITCGLESNLIYSEYALEVAGMGQKWFFMLVLCFGLSVNAQTSSPNPPSGTDQSHAKNKDEITVRGCVAKSSTDYILTQADQGNSYQLQGTKKLRFGPYLGQQIEVTGVESPTLSTSSDYLARGGTATSVTIRVHSIKTIQKRCSGN
jgi:hypothetical protein